MELEAESKAQRTWTPVLQVPPSEETVAIATFQWRRVPLTRPVVVRLLAVAAAIVVFCGVFAYALSSMGTKTYGARTEIVFPITAGVASGDFLRQDRLLATQLVAIKSRTVLAPVAKKYGTTVEDLSKQVVASIVNDSEVIRIEVDDASQARANAMVADVTKQYLGHTAVGTNADVEALLNSQIEALEGQRTTLTRALATAQAARLASADPNNPSANEQQIQAQLDDVNDQVSQAKTQLNAAAVDDVRTKGVTQLTQPYDVGKVAPKPLRAGIAGALAGMMIAAGVVVLLIRRRLKQMPLDQFG